MLWQISKGKAVGRDSVACGSSLAFCPCSLSWAWLHHYLPCPEPLSPREGALVLLDWELSWTQKPWKAQARFPVILCLPGVTGALKTQRLVGIADEDGQQSPDPWWTARELPRQQREVACSLGLGVRLPGFESQLDHALARHSWARS